MTKNGDRVVITAELLVNQFGSLDIDLFIFILTPFVMPQSEAFEEFDRTLETLNGIPDQPGKEGAIGAFMDLRNAYSKMSVFERESIRKSLPTKIVEFILKTSSKN